MKLSEHFKLEELINSNTAIRLNIDNNPSEDDINKLKLLCIYLEEIRDGFNSPLIITSGYRSKALNKALGGSTTSQHMKCEAVDINLGSKELNKKLFDFIVSTNLYDQIINEHSYRWVHVSFTINPRNEILEAYKDDNNKTKYKNIT